MSPFETLDARLISYARKTRVERADKIFREIEEENEKIKQTQEKAVMESREEKLKKLKKVLLR